MDFNEYQREAEKTIPEGMEKESMLINACMGLAGEAGEVIDPVKKWAFQHHDLDLNEIKDELSDVLWYCSELCTACGFSLEEVAIHNIEKLRKRYGEKFDSEKSRNRKEKDS